MVHIHTRIFRPAATMSGNNGKMLKVVGASWVRTRISTYILVGAALLAVGSLFLSEMERYVLKFVFFNEF